MFVKDAILKYMVSALKQLGCLNFIYALAIEQSTLYEVKYIVVLEIVVILFLIGIMHSCTFLTISKSIFGLQMLMFNK